MAADRIIPELSITLREHPDIVYASRFINTHDIAQYYKEISDQFNIKDEIASASNDFEIPNDALCDETLKKSLLRERIQSF
ncbi:20820_t:CDS:2 [Gigaspora rosea]|nr:20820_t:CDS:2 [Gigaspora rosea]